MRSRSEVEQQEAGATTLTNPQNTKNELTRKTAKKTQVETCNKFILAANTEDFKIGNPNKFKKNKFARTSADY